MVRHCSQASRRNGAHIPRPSRNNRHTARIGRLHSTRDRCRDRAFAEGCRCDPTNSLPRWAGGVGKAGDWEVGGYPAYSRIALAKRASVPRSFFRRSRRAASRSGSSSRYGDLAWRRNTSSIAAAIAVADSSNFASASCTVFLTSRGILSILTVRRPRMPKEINCSQSASRMRISLSRLRFSLFRSTASIVYSAIAVSPESSNPARWKLSA